MSAQISLSGGSAVPAAAAPLSEAAAPTASPAAAAPSLPLTPSKPGRLIFAHQGRVVYEWEQSLEEVSLYVRPPQGVKASHIHCVIVPRRLTLGIKGLPPFLDEPLACTCVAKESLWGFEDGELTVTLTKAAKGETWPCVCEGHGSLDALAETEAHRRMLLERFGQEHPGFDFSGAEVTGTVPDPRTFMGGI
jgi:hypothetical protein